MGEEIRNKGDTQEVSAQWAMGGAGTWGRGSRVKALVPDGGK